MNWGFLNQNRKAVQFLLIFVGLYLILKVIYGFFIQYFHPMADPFTMIVASHVVWFLSCFDSSVAAHPSSYKEYIVIANDLRNMIYVFEAYNGISPMIVYVSFLTAFRGPFRLFVGYFFCGIVAIYVMNISRLCMLYGVTFYFPDQVHFFQEYVLIGIIYFLVFALWYFWIRNVNGSQRLSFKQKAL